MFLFTFLIINSSFSFAQPVCCCADSFPNGFDFPVEQTTCSAVNGIIPNSPAYDYDSCGQLCLPSCGEDSCGGLIYNCLCGSQIVGEVSSFCCADESFTSTNSAECSSTCAETVIEYPISGYVKDLDNNPLVGASVRVNSETPVFTDINGYYTLNAGAGIITITAQMPDCSDKSEGPFELNGVWIENFNLDCSLPEFGCFANIGRICCGPNEYGIDSNGLPQDAVGNLNCLTGFTCYENSVSCEQTFIPGDDCVDGCDLEFNSFCFNGEVDQFDLQNPDNYDTYCGLCPFDAECQLNACQPNGCNNECPPGCSSDQDPDCGNSCNFGGSASWCDGDEFIIPTDNSGNPNTITYCEHCVNPLFCEVEIPDHDYECGDNNWDLLYGETCDYSFNLNAGCPINYECTTACVCQPAGEGCLAYESPVSVNAQNVFLSRTIQVNWIPPQNNCENFDSLELLRCIDEGENNCDYLNGYTQLATLDNTASSYVDSNNIIKKMNYCYIVIANYGDQQAQSLKACAETGEDICMDADNNDFFCYEGDIQYCNSASNEVNNVEEEENCNPGYCYDDAISGPSCRAEGACDNCNSLYGLYASFSLDNIGTFSPSHGANIGCDDLLEQNICFFDKTIGSVDKLYQCSEVSSCYDYLTQDTCGSDPCGKFENNDCEWKEYGLSMGICAATDPNEQQCDLCVEGNPIFPLCNKNLCSKFGDCYFSFDNDDNAQCSNMADTSCKNYATYDDCVASDGEFSLNQESIAGGIFNLSFDDNSVITYSDDYFNFGKCKWYEGSCYRDANNDEPNIVALAGQDCGSQQDFKCLKDFDNPSSYLITPDIFVSGANLNIGVGVYDATYYEHPNSIQVFSCFDNCPQTETSENYQRAEERIIHKDFAYSQATGMDREAHTIYYYARDPAKNLEPLNEFNFFVDRKRPELEFQYVYDSHVSEDDVWRSNVNASLIFHENVTCNILLKKDGELIPGIPSVSETRSSLFELQFFNLQDSNNYNLDLECIDDYGNPSLNNSAEMIIEGDKSITNVRPNKLVFGTLEHTIRIDTANQAVCRYSTEKELFSDMFQERSEPYNHVFQGEFERTSNGKEHAQELSFLNSGIYRFFTACEITYTNPDGSTYTDITEDNEGDIIMFSIDREPPITLLNKTLPPPETEMSFNRYYDYVTMKFQCFDVIKYNDGPKQWYLYDYGWDGRFNCENFMLCEVQEGESVCDLYEQELTHYEELVFDEPHIQNHTFMFYSVDAGGKTENVRTNTVMIDNTVPDFSFRALKNGHEVEELTIGTYTLDVQTTKQLSGVIQFTAIRGADWFDIENFLNQDGFGFQGYFELSSDLFYNQIGQLTFTMDVMDNNGLRTTYIVDMPYDTTFPEEPILNPIFTNSPSYEDNLGNFYPFKYYSGQVILTDGTVFENTYFTNDQNLFVTGISPIGLVELFVAQQPNDFVNTQYSYPLNEDNGFNNYNDYRSSQTTIAETNYLAGTNVVTLEGGPNSQYWEIGRYIAFTNSQNTRTSYHNFGKLYRIVDVQTSTDGLNTEISFVPNLEADINPGDQVYVFAKDRLNTWFGISLNLDYNFIGENNNVFFARVTNELGNKQRTSYMNLFFDNENPTITNIDPLPNSGLITNPDQILNITIVEDASGSGIKPSNVKLSFEQNGVTNYYSGDQISFNYLKTENGLRIYRLIFDPAFSWSNQIYSVQVFAEDYAGNTLNYGELIGDCDFDCSWNFEVDTNAVSRPKFSLIDAFELNPGIFGWSTNDATPSFILNYTKRFDGTPETTNIILSEVEIIGNTIYSASCSEIEFNIYLCQADSSLPENLYELTAYSNKDLGGGNLGPDSYHIFNLIIDQTAPEFTLEAETPSGTSYFTSEEEIAIHADLITTEYDLMGIIHVGNQQLTITPTKEDNRFTFLIPETFDWGEEGSKIVNVEITDFSGLTNTEQTIVILDSSIPTIEITQIIAERYFLNSDRNVTVGNTDLTVRGIVSEDSYSLCYGEQGGEQDCLFRCVGDETNCISADNDFEISMILDGGISIERLNTLILSSEDYAGNEMSESLFVLLDLRAPAEPTIIIE